MDLAQAGSALQGRTASFSDGIYGTPSMYASSLNRDSAVLNAKVAGTMATPHSVLQSIIPSGNGKSAADAERSLPGGYTMPTPNGISEGNYDAYARMRMVNGGIHDTNEIED